MLFANIQDSYHESLLMVVCVGVACLHPKWNCYIVVERKSGGRL
jgi:hypothetical protein